MSVPWDAEGLTADWLNGWLAAIGVTVTVPGVKLSWSDQAIPFAVFHTNDNCDLFDSVATALPSEEDLQDSIIARTYGDLAEFQRRVSLDAYRQRAVAERARRSVHLAASVSDLRDDIDPTSLDHGAFDPAVPRGETLWSRAMACSKAIPTDNRVEVVRLSLTGQLLRVQANGLGFDPRRLPSSVQASGKPSKVHVDPVVELLCFAALALFPTRGNGRQVRQRGWIDRSTQRGAFRWVAWRPALDSWAIDALLDANKLHGNTVISRYGVVPYRPSTVADPTRAYFGERLHDS